MTSDSPVVLEEFIQQGFRQLTKEKIDPWLFMRNEVLQVTRIDGSPISYEGMQFGGFEFPATSSTIYLRAGWRRIGYTCPNQLTVDRPPTTTAVFEAGASYQLKCVGSEAVIQRIG